MSSSKKSSRGVQAGLLVFGIPFVVAISALAFLPQLPAIVAANADALMAAAGIGALGVVLTFLLAWFADRRTVHRLDAAIEEITAELNLKDKELELKDNELEAKSEQHALELAIKQQELDQQNELLTRKAQIGDLENELKIRDLKLERLAAQQTTPDSAAGESVDDLLIEKTEVMAREGEQVLRRKNPVRTVSSGAEGVKKSL